MSVGEPVSHLLSLELQDERATYLKKLLCIAVLYFTRLHPIYELKLKVESKQPLKDVIHMK